MNQADFNKVSEQNICVNLELKEIRIADILFKEEQEICFDFQNGLIKELSESDENLNSSIKTKKYQMHSAEIKHRSVEMAMITNNPKYVAEIFNVSLKSLRRWMMVGPDRRKGGGRKIRDPEMEKRLCDWYNDLHYVKCSPVTSRMIKNKALELSIHSDFNASKGWLEKIKKKYNFVISRKIR